MKKVDMIIRTGHMYTMSGDGCGYEYGKGVVVDGSKIIDVIDFEAAAGKYIAEKYIDARDKIVLPGFIDGHMHTGHAVMRGVAQDINYWMMEGMAPFEAARSSEAKTAGSRLAIAEAIMSGTTTIGDDSSDIEGSVEFIDKCKIRGNVSVRVRSALPKPYKAGELYEFSDEMGGQTLGEGLRLYDKYHNRDGGRIKIRFSPQGADFLPLDLLMKVKQIAKDKNTKLILHLAQGSRETDQMMMRYGRRTIPLLDEMDFFDEDVIGIHLTEATRDEIQTVVSKGTSMVLCSNSIGLINGKVPPAVEFIEAGGTVGLGTDQSPGNNGHNMFSEMKATAIYNKIKYQSSTIMPAWKVLRMATVEGAKALGIDDITGSIEIGKYADIILLDCKCPTLAPIYTVPMRNMIPNIVYAARGHEVDTVIAHGRVIVEGRIPQTFDMEEIVTKAQSYAYEIGTKAAPLFNEINGMNAQYMRENKL